ncbi:MAG: ribonuclease D [Gammaproteobacteria bacterium]|nr:ribonuclease D [Gammaproteobacteria bacterium]
MLCKDGELSINSVTSNQALADAVSSWQQRIGLDTEFMRTSTFYPLPGLYQIASGDRVFLLDPLSITDWTPFIAYLEDPATTKIMHACLEDLELINHHLNVVPVNVFDTQFAQAFLSQDYSLSYAALLQKRVEVFINKHETRSDWLQRPLTDQQIKYAVEDVVYLEALYSGLSSDLESANKQAWFEREMTARCAYQPGDPQKYYRNLKKAWQLDSHQLATLQRLCAWREETARLENVPRNRVVWDDHLYEFSIQDDLNQDHVFMLLPRAVARKYCDGLLGAHESSSTQQPRALARPLTSKQGATVKALRSIGVDVAQRIEIAPELICRKKDLEECVRYFGVKQTLSPHYQGWRADLVQTDFLQVLNGS